MVNDISTRHGFLAELHRALKPWLYVEVGVQTGASLSLASPKTMAIGIDPHPVLSVSLPPNHQVYAKTSDDFFEETGGSWVKAIDLAFIDGMHLVEFALRDYFNIEQHAHQGSVIVFDDVLPRNQAEAAREMCPGDWTGDVWKVGHFLYQYCPDLPLRLVNTQPTGLLVVTHPKTYRDQYTIQKLIPRYTQDRLNDPVPDDIINRVYALQPNCALREIMRELET